MDVDLGRELARSFKKQGMTILTGTGTPARAAGDRRDRHVTDGEGKEQALEAERVLVAVGRAPLTDGIGLEQAGVRTDKGFVTVDAGMRTSAKGCTRSATSSVRSCSRTPPPSRASSRSRRWPGSATAGTGSIRHACPCASTSSEVAAVGLSEADARAAGRDVQVGKFPFRALGKAMAAGHTDGFVKLVADKRYGEIVGVHMIGVGVTDLIAEAGLGRTLEATTAEVAETVHAHPTLAEAFKEAALAARGEAVNI
jgi:dihydrolipoamide dehydrogenase